MYWGRTRRCRRRSGSLSRWQWRDIVITADSNIVFLVDVDNTLLDSDRVTADLMRYLERAVGPERLQRYRVEYPRDPRLLCVSAYLVKYPFANRLFPNSLDVLERFAEWGRPVIL